MKQIFTRSLFLIVVFSTTTFFTYSQGIGTGNGIGIKPQIKPVLSAEQIAKQYLSGVTLIVCEDGKGNYSQGSGFFVAPGMILTNAHVVKGMVRGFVTTGKEQKKNLINAVAYFNSENTDLALLVSDEAKSAKTPILPLAQPNDLSIGETIYVLSNPKGLSGTISQGIVSSGIRRMKSMDLLQITAPISEGSSGGAVMNSRGEVVGIATSSLQSGQNLNFAAPAARIGQFLDEFLTLPSPPEYIVVSKFSGSWIAPQSFLNESKNNKEQPSSSIKSSEPSTFTKTATWLTNKISGMRGYYDDNNFFEYKNFSINGCNLSFNELQINNEGTVWMINSY